MAVLFTTPHVTLTLDPDTRLIRYARTRAPYASMAEYVHVHERVARVLDGVGRKKHALLVDMREAPLNNDPDFERTAARCRQLLVRDFGKVAVVVRTAIGALQIGRHIREDSSHIPIFHDETTAVGHLLGVNGFDAEQMIPPSSRIRAPGSARPRSSSKSGSSGSGSSGSSNR